MPHSEIPGSKPVDGSPELIAVFRVLHSLLMPRHPSCARIRLARTAFPPSLPYEKFLALWRGSLPADLVYELQFSFNFQLPVVKDRSRLRSESFGAVNDLQKRTLEKTANARAPSTGPRANRFHLAVLTRGLRPAKDRCLLRKEVIQPLVPQRLPCYDFIPITTHTLGGQMPDFGCRRLS